MPLSEEEIRALARQAGFDLAGICSAEPHPDAARFLDWVRRGLAGRMTYLSDHRAQVRSDPRQLLPEARSLIVAACNYNGPQPYSVERSEAELGWIARYAWGPDYHGVLREALERLAALIGQRLPRGETFRWRACVDTAPLLERSYARQAGLGWIGRNTCLINQQVGSWLLLGVLLTSLDLPPTVELAPDRCGSCTRCIDACPTAALVPSPRGGWELDARLCISYFTIELKGEIPETHRPAMGRNVFGCDICQDVCPWNRRAAVTLGSSFASSSYEAPNLEWLASLEEAEFRRIFRPTPVDRARYAGFLRNVAVAMGNAGLERFRAPLERLAGSPLPGVATHARWALERIRPAEPLE